MFKLAKIIYVCMLLTVFLLPEKTKADTFTYTLNVTQPEIGFIVTRTDTYGVDKNVISPSAAQQVFNSEYRFQNSGNVAIKVFSKIENSSLPITVNVPVKDEMQFRLAPQNGGTQKYLTSTDSTIFDSMSPGPGTVSHNFFVMLGANTTSGNYTFDLVFTAAKAS